MWIVFHEDLILKISHGLFLTVRQRISRRFISIKYDKFELIFNLKRNLRSNTFLARLEKVEKGLQKKNIYLIWVNSLSTYHFFIWSEASPGYYFCSVIDEKWITTTWIYIHSRNLNIRKNFLTKIPSHKLLFYAYYLNIRSLKMEDQLNYRIT